MSQSKLYFRLSVCSKSNRKLLKVARAIVAGHERVGNSRPVGSARATLRDGLLTLFVPPQLAQSALFWMEAATQGYDIPSEPRDNLRTHNCLTLIWKSGCILMPEAGPNGGYGVRNGAPMAADATAIAKAEAKNFRVD